MERVESLNSFLSPSGGWAGAQCRTADQKQSICSLTFLHPSPVKEAKVTEQRGYPICHPSPATKPLANTLVFNLSSPVVWHQCLVSHHSPWALRGALCRQWGEEEMCWPGNALVPGLGPHSLNLLPYLEHWIFTHSSRGSREGTGRQWPRQWVATTGSPNISPSPLPSPPSSTPPQTKTVLIAWMAAQEFAFSKALVIYIHDLSTVTRSTFKSHHGEWKL